MHHPDNVGKAEGWAFHRCRCGFTLAVPPTGRNSSPVVYWLRAAKSIKPLGNKDELAAAVATRCPRNPDDWQKKRDAAGVPA
jgi:hypothetical protein